MNVLAKMQVLEDHGIRRFLYPLAVELPQKPADEKLAVLDNAGNLLPCEQFSARNRTVVVFAISLGPYERKRLSIVKAEETAPIPDPLHFACDSDGYLVNRQERFATKLTSALDLVSVIYDGVEHLAGPVKFQLNGASPSEEKFKTAMREGVMGFAARTQRVYDGGGPKSATEVSLTACKSWVALTHTVTQPPAGSVISLSVPLTPGDYHEIPVCDFGVGNGAYAKVDGHAVVFDANLFGKGGNCFWQISRDHEGIERAEYQGQASKPKDLAQHLWFHWTLSNRSLALAITDVPKGCVQLNVRLARNGKIDIVALLGDSSPKEAALGACLHFLNAVPPLAAATNPASILCPPAVTLKT